MLFAGGVLLFIAVYKVIKDFVSEGGPSAVAAGQRANFFLTEISKRGEMTTRQIIAHADVRGCGYIDREYWRTTRLLCKLADLGLIDNLGDGQWAITDEGMEKAAEMPYFFDGSAEWNAKQQSGTELTHQPAGQ